MTKKILSAVLALMFILTAFAGCTDAKIDEEPTTENENVAEEAVSNETQSTVINVSLLKGPTGMGGAYIWEKSENGTAANNYNITLDTDATTVGPKLMTGEYDIAAVPTNLAASLYQKSQGKVKVVAVNTLGVLYIVTKDNAISSVEDLKGKTILASGQGTIAEYALNYVLESNELAIGTDVTIEFATEHAESVTKALAGGYDAVLLPEPFVSQIITKDASFSVAINITEEWEKTGDCTLAMGCIAVNSKFYEENKEAVKTFIAEYNESVNYVNGNINDASIIIEKHGIMPAAVAVKAIPNANIVCLTGAEMKDALSSCYNVLLNQNAKIIGGQMPGDDFYIDTNA